MSSPSNLADAQGVVLLNDPSIGNYKCQVVENDSDNLPDQIVHFSKSSDLVEYGHCIEDMLEKDEMFMTNAPPDPVMLLNFMYVYLVELYRFRDRWGATRVPLSTRRKINELETHLLRDVTSFPPQFGVLPVSR